MLIRFPANIDLVVSGYQCIYLNSSVFICTEGHSNAQYRHDGVSPIQASHKCHKLMPGNLCPSPWHILLPSAWTLGNNSSHKIANVGSLRCRGYFGVGSICIWRAWDYLPVVLEFLHFPRRVIWWLTLVLYFVSNKPWRKGVWILQESLLRCNNLEQLFHYVASKHFELNGVKAKVLNVNWKVVSGVVLAIFTPINMLDNPFPFFWSKYQLTNICIIWIYLIAHFPAHLDSFILMAFEFRIWIMVIQVSFIESLNLRIFTESVLLCLISVLPPVLVPRHSESVPSHSLLPYRSLPDPPYPHNATYPQSFQQGNQGLSPHHPGSPGGPQLSPASSSPSSPYGVPGETLTYSFFQTSA